MTGYPLSTGEAVQHVLEGRECESEGDGKWKMRLIGGEARIATPSAHWSVSAGHAKLRWRLVPVRVKREEALKALAAGAAIKRGERCYATGLDDPLRCFSSKREGSSWPPLAGELVEDLLDDTACWEILP